MPSVFLYIHHVSVDPGARRLGVGTLLLDAAFDLARDVGVTRVEVDVWAANAPATEFFASAGLSAHNIRMSRDF
jgi:GNAT superfamily N-acetyltransferase